MFMGFESLFYCVQEDPTVNEFQEQIAAESGHEAALFVTSGTLSNQVEHVRFIP